MNPSRILIVEDETITSMEIEERLSAMGYQVVGCAAGGEEALALTEEQRPDLVLMDIHLRGVMDGITAAGEIRRSFHTPVVFLTAYSEDETIERAKLAEPHGYILKPFGDRELKSTIEIALYKNHADEEIRRLNRLYDVLSRVNETIVHTRSSEELLSSVCRLIVERGEIDLAWIGWLDPLTSRISPVARYGDQRALLSEARFHADERPEGQGAPGKAVRTGEPFACNECGRGECFYPSAKAPVSFGFRSCGSFPLRFKGEVCGVLNVCAAEAGFFREREMELLKEVALSISFGMDKIDGDARCERLTEQLQRKCTFLQTLMDAMPYPVFYKDAQLRYLGCNTAFERFSGVERDQLVGMTDFDISPRELADIRHRADRELLESAEPGIYEGAMLSSDGAPCDVLLHMATFRNPDGAVAGIIGAAEDITERKKAEATVLQQQEELKRAHDQLALRVVEQTEKASRTQDELDAKTKLFDAVLRKMPAGVIIREAPSGSLIIANKQAEEIWRDPFLEVARIEEYGQYRCYHQDGRPYEPQEWPIVRSVQRGEVVWNEEMDCVRSDGSTGTVSVNSCPVFDAEGKAVAGVVVFYDITARKRMERDLEEKSNRLHEVNSALKALLRQRDEDRKEFEGAIVTNIENLVLPYLKRLKVTPLSSAQEALVEVLESHVRELTSKCATNLALQFRILTPTEMRVAALVREGKSTKEIAELLCITHKTVSFHRDSIRTKLRLRGNGINLRSHLLSLS